jgi:CarD family transcriptional regulator
MNGNGDFHIGDKVVYPNHGVGIIEQISSRTMGTTVEKFYMLKIAASNAKVTVPFANVSSVGMRPVVRNGEVEKIVDYLSSGECINAADWKDRFKENSDRMRTGSLADVAAVLKSLLILGTGQVAFLPRKKDAGARALSAGQRNRHLAKLRGEPD